MQGALLRDPTLSLATAKLALRRSQRRKKKKHTSSRSNLLIPSRFSIKGSLGSDKEILTLRGNNFFRKMKSTDETLPNSNGAVFRESLKRLQTSLSRFKDFILLIRENIKRRTSFGSTSIIQIHCSVHWIKYNTGYGVLSSFSVNSFSKNCGVVVLEMRSRNHDGRAIGFTVLWVIFFVSSIER